MPAASRWRSPGWIDRQVNGLAGVDFGAPDLTPEAALAVARRLRAGGVTRFLPTLITAEPDRLAAALRRLAAARAVPEFAAAVPGFHLEGPWISPADGPRGAHPLSACRNPNWDDFRRWQDAAGGLVKLVTLAPELPGALPIIEKLVAAGVVVALGHTAADDATLFAGAAAGATLSTHLGNGCHDTLHRHRNPILAQLGEDRLSASLIADGHHLPPHVMKAFARAKGSERVILVSDAVRHAGLPPGIYSLEGTRQVEVRADGFIGIVGEPRLAGSGLTLDRGVAQYANFAGLPMTDALAAVTANPARLMGWADAGAVEFDWSPGDPVCTIRRVDP